MRRFVILFMVLLLPLRAWAGDAMSLQMVTSRMAAVAAEAAMPADCPMHASVPAAGHHDGEAEQAPGSSCTSCDLCLPLAELAVATADAAPLARHVMRPAAGMMALGIAAPPSVKPPIS